MVVHSELAEQQSSQRVGDLPYVKNHSLASSTLNHSQNIQPSWLVAPVGRVGLFHCTEVTWNTGGTAESSTKLEENVMFANAL
jgi:hypothetical protein